MPPDLIDQFQAGLKFLNKNQKTIKDMRNTLGGHVSKDAVSAALAAVTSKAEATCVISNDAVSTHFKVAEPLCALITFHERTPEQVKVLFYEIHRHSHNVIHNAFAAYVTARQLMPP